MSERKDRRCEIVEATLRETIIDTENRVVTYSIDLKCREILQDRPISFDIQVEESVEK